MDGNGNLLIADTGNHVIRRMPIDGIDPCCWGKTELVAGVPKSPGKEVAHSNNRETAKFRKPKGLAFDRRGNLYVADNGNGLIRKISGDDGSISTIAGSGTLKTEDGVGPLASFNSPTQLTVDQKGNLFVLDDFDNVIRYVDTLTGCVTTLDLQGYLLTEPKGMLWLPDSGDNRGDRLYVGTRSGLIGFFLKR
jgi:sugar lactone lactonase YvrE